MSYFRGGNTEPHQGCFVLVLENPQKIRVLNHQEGEGCKSMAMRMRRLIFLGTRSSISLRSLRESPVR